MRGKRYKNLCGKTGGSASNPLDKAVALIGETRSAKFDESVEAAVKLGIDPKHADQQIRGSFVLPHGTGRDRRVLVFAREQKASEAREAGADWAGLEDLLAKIRDGNWLEFDVAIACPDVMAEVGKLGKFLGPRGLMPSPKMGTVTMDVAKMVRQSKGGRVEIKSDKGGVVHAPVAKSSFESAKIRDNILFFFSSLVRMKPLSSKGEFLKKASVSNTMGPGIGLDLANIREEVKKFSAVAR